MTPQEILYNLQFAVQDTIMEIFLPSIQQILPKEITIFYACLILFFYFIMFIGQFAIIYIGLKEICKSIYKTLNGTSKIYLVNK